MRRKYAVQKFLDESTGGERDFALVPLDELEQPPAQRNLIQRIAGLLRRTDERDQEVEPTTDTGMSLFAGSTSALIALRYYEELKVNQARMGMLNDYERMDAECVEVQTALDITIGNAFLPVDGDQESHEVVTDDSQVKEILDACDKRLEIFEALPEIARSLLRAGDSFEEPVVDATPRIARLKYLNPKYMIRKEDPFGRLLDQNAFEMRDESNQLIAEFQPWQVIHTRFRHQRGDLYGRSFFFNSRRPWRQLAMMEDGVCIRYLTRAGKRFAFYIPVPKNAQPDEKRKLVENAIQKLKRRSTVDSDGKMDLRRNPIADDEDFYIPVEDGAEGRARVDMLDTGGMNDNLAPVMYFRDKVVLPTRVPKAYMGLEQDTRGRAMLGWQDVEFGRVVRSVQKTIAGFQRKLYDLELRLHGITPEDDLYWVKYPPISFVDEQMKVAVEQLRWQVAQVAKTQLGIPLRWLLAEVIGLSEEDQAEILNNLEPVQQQQQGFGGGPPQQAISQKDAAAIKESVFTNMRLQSEISDLKGRIKLVLAEGLHRPLEQSRTPEA